MGMRERENEADNYRILMILMKTYVPNKHRYTLKTENKMNTYIDIVMNF